MDLSLYPKIPGKNWTITKAAFTSIASTHGLDAALNGLPDDASDAAVLNHKSNCKLMYSALMLATNSGDDAWIVKSHGLSRVTITTIPITTIPITTIPKASGRPSVSGMRVLVTSTPGTSRL